MSIEHIFLHGEIKFNIYFLQDQTINVFFHSFLSAVFISINYVSIYFVVHLSNFN